MPMKRLLVLANSWKKLPSRCVAGREITMDEKNNLYIIGDWIRPVSAQGQEGSLSPSEITLNTGSTVAVWDFVRVPVSGPSGNPYQPENCTIDGSQWMSVTSKYQKPPLSLLEENPPDLWLQPGVKTDRVEHAYLQTHLPAQTLYCIRPTQLTLSFYTNAFANRKRRVEFAYNGVDYDLGLTDPVASDRYCPNVPAQGQPSHDRGLNVNDHLLCVSLAGDFNGWHYKVVAAVL